MTSDLTSVIHTPVNDTSVEYLSSHGLDCTRCHGCEGSKHQSVTRPAERPDPSSVLWDSKPSLLPLRPPLTPPVLCWLSLAIWPAANLDMLPLLMVSCGLVTVFLHSNSLCMYTFRNTHAEMTNRWLRERLAFFQTKWLVALFYILIPYSDYVKQKRRPWINLIQARHCQL